MIKVETPKMIQENKNIVSNLSNELASVKASDVKGLTEQYANLLKKLQNKLG